MNNETTKLEFLTPTDQDNYSEKEIAPNTFKIMFEGEELTAKFSKPEIGKTEASMELISFPAHYDRRMKKLIGYCLFKILPKYSVKS